MSEKIPKGWTNKLLNNLLSIPPKEKVADPASIELLTVKLHGKGIVRSGKFPKPTENGRPYYKRFSGELLVGRQSLHNGGLGLVGTETSGLIASNAISSFINTKMSDLNFLHQLFLTEEFQSQIDNLSLGTAQREASEKQILNCKVLCPPLPEQKKIALILTSVDEVIENTQKRINKLKDLKKAVMNELLTKGIGHTEFKETELGRIPKSWDVMRLGEKCILKGGKRLPKGSSFSDNETPFPYLRVSDFRGKTIDPSEIKYVSGEIQKSISRYTISSSDIYISIAGSIGLVGTVPDFLDNSLLTENAAKIQIKDQNLDRDYLLTILSSERMQSQFNQAKGTGGGVPKLALFRIEETLLTIPSKKEQLQIAKIVATISTQIIALIKKADELSSLKKSLMQDLLTGKVRVKVN